MYNNDEEFYELSDSDVLLILHHMPDKINEPYFQQRMKAILNHNSVRANNACRNNISCSSVKAINA